MPLAVIEHYGQTCIIPRPKFDTLPAVIIMSEDGLPKKLTNELRAVHWLDPWWCFCLDEVSFGRTFESELQDELCAAHTLYQHRLAARAIAKRGDCDDVLFWIPDAEQWFAVVHLTWSMHPETDPVWPETQLFKSIEEFVSREMQPTHREWSDS